MALEKFSYDNKIVKYFVIATVIFGLVGMLVGLTAAIQLFYPDLNFGLQYTTFGRIRPLHTNAVIFAFVGNAMFAGTSGALTFFHVLHSSGIWLEVNESAQMAQGCMRFCKAYVCLATGCHGLRLCRYHFEPSLHGFFHFYFELRDCTSVVMNPACQSCEADEDYVGKVARLARCVHAGTTTVRVIDRILIKTHFELEEPNL